MTLGFLAVAQLIGGAVWRRRYGDERARALGALVVGVAIFFALWLVAALLVWAPLAATVVRAAAIAATWAALTLGLGAAILSRAGTHRRVASGSRPVELAAWQTPTPVAGVVAARRPVAVAKEAPLKRARFGIARALRAAALGLGAERRPRWRSFDVSRQLRDTPPQRIRSSTAPDASTSARPTTPLLYAMHLRYDELARSPAASPRRGAAQHRRSASSRAATASPRRPAARDSGELRARCCRAPIPLDLDMEFGGTQATLELGGLALQSVRLECGATDATLAFTTPNRVRMRELDVSVGAAEFTARHLANANADQIRVRGGVGTVDLDFGGTGRAISTCATRLAIGKLTLRVPDDVGVRLEVQRVAAGFDHEGLVKRDDGWYSQQLGHRPAQAARARRDRVRPDRASTAHRRR